MNNTESTIAGVSVRAIIVLTLILVFSAAVFLNINNEALNSVVMAAIGWYFGQKSGSPSKEITVEPPVSIPEPPPVFIPPSPSPTLQCKCPSCGTQCI